MKCAIEMDSGAVLFIPSFIKIGTANQTLMGGNTHTYIHIIW
jgi:hypothetical protein